jgi:hypothetical protein
VYRDLRGIGGVELDSSSELARGHQGAAAGELARFLAPGSPQRKSDIRRQSSFDMMGTVEGRKSFRVSFIAIGSASFSCVDLGNRSVLVRAIRFIRSAVFR